MPFSSCPKKCGAIDNDIFILTQIKLIFTKEIRHSAGADLGGGCRGCTPTPRDDLRFSNTTGILQKKTMWFIGVEVEEETSAPPPKKNPGSAPAQPHFESESFWNSKMGYLVSRYSFLTKFCSQR